MKKYLKPIILILLISIIIFVLYKFITNDSINIKNQELEINNVLKIRLGERTDNEIVLNSMLFKSFDEYKKFMKNYNVNLNLEESNFDKYDYVLDFQMISKCTEEKDKDVSKIDIKESVMTITYKTYNKCNTCEFDEIENVAYFIPVKKGLLKGLLPLDNKFENVNSVLECK